MTAMHLHYTKHELLAVHNLRSAQPKAQSVLSHQSKRRISLRTGSAADPITTGLLLSNLLTPPRKRNGWQRSSGELLKSVLK
jgi:hypothetical protein